MRAPSWTPWAEVEAALLEGLFDPAEVSAPPPIVMSAPAAEDSIVLNLLKFPKATPLLAPVVQRVIGPPEVPNNLGLAALAPSLEVIRPADFTRIPPLPAVISALSAVVPEEWIAIGPFVELKAPVPV